MDERTPKPERSRIHYLSWDVLSDILVRMGKSIQADGIPQIMVGIQRGGLIPAVMLSHQLGIQTILSLPVQRTTSDAIYASKVSPLPVPQDHFQQVTDCDIVVVDDIVGSGVTLRAVLHLLSKYEPARIRCATCCVNRAEWDPTSGQEPGSVITYIGRELSGWVVFPWEKNVASYERSHYGNECQP